MQDRESLTGATGATRGARAVGPGRYALAVAAALLLAACAPTGGTTADADADAGAAEAQRYELRGEVLSVDVEAATITLEHEPVEDFMGAMRMPFNVRQSWVLEAAEPGARVRATLVVQGTSSWLEEVVINKPADRSKTADVVVSQPQAGDPVPNTPLVDQDGEAFTTADLAGEWWVFTFIYTTCPLEDFCPAMSRNFAALHEAIDASPERYGDPLLLSITVDPARDTPEVLREYGLRYLANDDGFARWRFARAEAEPLGELARFTGLRFMPERGEVLHSLRTVIVDPEGHAVDTLVGNRWQPDELLETLAAAVAERPGGSGP